MGILGKLFGIKSIDFREMLQRGAVIVDVRTPAEYNSGHIQGSINLPLQTLSSSMGKLQKDKPIITCCASGMRSGSAKAMLKSNGFKEVENGGGWTSLRNNI
ncbi:MAG: rhodanese-like domain-containing protein [Flavobacteriia bacterium]|nr:rhodanese-like domain-containing protein [Flavobacteriia bacterium]